MSPARTGLLPLIDLCLNTEAPDHWRSFVDETMPFIAGVVARSALRWGQTSREAIEDLTQETFLKLCKDNYKLLRRLSECTEENVRGYLKVAVTNLVHDHFRAERAESRYPDAGFLSGEILDDVLGDNHAVSRLERQLQLDEIDRVLTKELTGETAARDRRIFWLCHRSGMTARAIASIPGIGLTDKGVESTLHRVGVLLKTQFAMRKGIHAKGAS
jgi:RNA polymerase sigma factor (sigma-70 family)